MISVILLRPGLQHNPSGICFPQAVKSDINELGYDKACENITITNCRFFTSSDGIRLGYEGDGAIRRITTLIR